MTRAELIDIVAGKVLDVRKQDIANVVAEVFDSMGKALSRHDRIEIRGFGIFTPVFRKGRVARNPQTGAPAEVPERWAVKFSTSSTLKKEM